jgi:hypothetical protein
MATWMSLGILSFCPSICSFVDVIQRNVQGAKKTVTSMKVTKGKVSFTSEDTVEITGVARFESIDTSAKVVIELTGAKDLVGDLVFSNAVFNIYPLDDAKRQAAVTHKSNVAGSQKMTNSASTTGYLLLVGIVITVVIVPPCQL